MVKLYYIRLGCVYMFYIFEIIPILLVVVFWLVICYIIISGAIKGKKRQNKRNEVYSKVKLEKASDIQTYVDMLKNNKDLEEKRKKYNNCKLYVLLIIIIVGCICFFTNWFHPIIIFVVILVSAVIFALANAGYTKVYKDQVITSILKNYDKDLNYMPENGIKKEIYRTAKFEFFDRYTTEDLIVGKICELEFALADVHTEIETTDSDGNTSYSTVFRGPVAVVELNKFKDLVLNISDNNSKLFKGNEYVELDNQMFEEKYDVFTNNDVVAMRILTPTLTTKILEMHDKFGFFFEIKLIDGLVFFRFHSDTLFNPCPSNIEKEATDIAFYFNMLDGMKNIMEEIIKTLNEFER